MSLDPISAASTTPKPAATGGALTGNKDEFLKLFMAQLEHQDPLDPKTGSDMVAQLAQFSAVEQAQQTNSQLGALAASQASTASAGMATLVGRTCQATADSFTIDATGGAPPPLAVTSSGPTTGASIVIKNAKGDTVRTIAVPDGTTDRTLAWDGKDDHGRPVPPGGYQITIDQGKTSAAITAKWSGRVDAVELTSDGPRLRMGDVLLTPSDISTIGVAS